MHEKEQIIKPLVRPWKPCKGFSYVLILPLYITAIVRPCVAYYKGFYFVCACVVCKLQRILIKIFLDFEIENGFDRGMFFFFSVRLICPNRGGGYTSRSRGGVSAENSDKNKKALF